MEHMTRRIMFAAVLGILVGLAVGYSPPIQPAAAPRTLVMQQVTSEQPNIGGSLTQAAPNTLLLLLAALAAGLLFATPVFIVANRRGR